MESTRFELPHGDLSRNEIMVVLLFQETSGSFSPSKNKAFRCYVAYILHAQVQGPLGRVTDPISPRPQLRSVQLETDGSCGNPQWDAVPRRITPVSPKKQETNTSHRDCWDLVQRNLCPRVMRERSGDTRM